jgi:hypothetical protein
MRKVFAVTLLVAGFNIGCGSGSSVINIAGEWQFSGNSTKFGYVFAGNAVLTQTGQSASGTMGVLGSPCAPAGLTANFSGTINGTSISATLDEDGQNVSLKGTFTEVVRTEGISYGDQMTGTYSAPSGGCLNGDTGTWIGERISYDPQTTPLDRIFKSVRSDDKSN